MTLLAIAILVGLLVTAAAVRILDRLAANDRMPEAWVRRQNDLRARGGGA